MSRRLELRDLRSLERPSMYSIFAPLDDDERLPRELIQEGKRYRRIGRREVAGLAWLPALAIAMGGMSWLNITGLWALALILLMFFGFVGFALTDR
jgi:hypothetical protein